MCIYIYIHILQKYLDFFFIYIYIYTHIYRYIHVHKHTDDFRVASRSQKKPTPLCFSLACNSRLGNRGTPTKPLIPLMLLREIGFFLKLFLREASGNKMHQSSQMASKLPFVVLLPCEKSLFRNFSHEHSLSGYCPIYLLPVPKKTNCNYRWLYVKTLKNVRTSLSYLRSAARSSVAFLPFLKER